MYPELKRIAFLGGHTPRRCGIATFTSDLHEAVAAASPSTDCMVAAINDHQQRYVYPKSVRFELEERDPGSYRRAADYLNFNNVDVLSIQHEFGIFGGPAGSYLLGLLREVKMPVVTTLHTILTTPDIPQRKVMDELIRRSDRLVVMAQKGASILREVYGVDNGKIDVIPHGIPDVPLVDADVYKEQFGVGGRFVILTFGLLGPGKGIEYAIRALPSIVARHPEVVYVVLGATHPHLVAREGESYRLGLERLAEDYGVKEHVIFHNRFVSADDLKEFISAADIYLTPYPNEAQITSGTLAQAFGAGRAVVSTPYWHAQELITPETGVLVKARDSESIADGVLQLLDDPERMGAMRTRAYEQARAMTWPNVAASYLQSFNHAKADQRRVSRSAFAGWTLASRYDLPELRMDHLFRMTDGTGIFQHACYNVPNYNEGYCTDDNARALILCCRSDEHGGRASHANLDALLSTYLAFMAAAINRDTGRFRNFMAHDRRWLEEYGSEDSHGRAVWALGTCAARSRNDGHRLLSIELYERSLGVLEGFTSPRAWAAGLLGISEYLRTFPGHGQSNEMRSLLVSKLVEIWNQSADDDWPWFEQSLSYDNARLPEALILAGHAIPDPEALEIGLKALKWLASIQTTSSGHFRPVGSNGFYQRDGIRADFDQQPIEAQAMVSASLAAAAATSLTSWKKEAKRAFEWFLGRNDLGLPLYDPRTGGCCDGLHPDRVNSNQGAESTLAFAISLVDMHQAEEAFSASVQSA
ncbi:glycosyltransferase family 4 protein [Luteolibacter yonseiensis]|uniref:Glycosyltransferase family 4 protein n=1 Tax=Luteolibacter yonseiensis TaxID=1144680 RepID=A0A934V9E7_9BACT|nr:glycosyltransferase family 4 protein [Luteolibacter yonseiensis]MBK1818257.1 glycosyltransferase family 4 protein [Luteolibacter yonseiensis]